MVDRQSVIERAINVENLLCSLITRHFFKEHDGINLDFMHTVLYDPLANSGFKINVFHKCYPDLAKKEIENLRRIFSIRNFFAHAGLYIRKVADPDAIGFISPKNKEEFLDFEKLSEEFNEKANEAEKLLAQLLKKAGINFYNAPPPNNAVE